MIIELASLYLIHTAQPKPQIVTGDSQVIIEIKAAEAARAEAEQVRIKSSPSYTKNPGVEIVKPDNTNNCVLWAKRFTGIDKPLGYGARHAVEGIEPKVGAILAEKSISHAMVVENIAEGGVWAVESNYVKGYITRRFIPYSDILGYVYKS